MSLVPSTVSGICLIGDGLVCVEEVYSEVETCFKALSERLDNSTYFFGSKPTELGNELS